MESVNVNVGRSLFGRITNNEVSYVYVPGIRVNRDVSVINFREIDETTGKLTGNGCTRKLLSYSMTFKTDGTVLTCAMEISRGIS